MKLIKSENTVIHKRDVHTYIDWFDTMKEVATSADKCRKLSRKVRR